MVIDNKEEPSFFEIPDPQEQDWALILWGQRKCLEKKIKPVFYRLVQT